MYEEVDGKYVYVYDRNLGKAIVFLTKVRPYYIKLEDGNKVMSFRDNEEFRRALDYLLSYE